MWLFPGASYLSMLSGSASEERSYIKSKKSKGEPVATILNGVRICECLLKFFLEPCVALFFCPTCTSLVWAIKWATHKQSPCLEGFTFLSSLVLETVTTATTTKHKLCLQLAPPSPPIVLWEWGEGNDGRGRLPMHWAGLCYPISKEVPSSCWWGRLHSFPPSFHFS